MSATLLAGVHPDEAVAVAHDGKLALNAAVLRPGTISVGDTVRLVRPTD